MKVTRTYYKKFKSISANVGKIQKGKILFQEKFGIDITRMTEDRIEERGIKDYIDSDNV